jgi:DNA repair protein RadC
MKTYKADTPEITLKYKSSGVKKTKITNSQDSYELFKQMYNGDTLEYCESSVVIYLNRANNLIGWQKISQGGITGTVVDVRMILATALKCGATGIILSHNHPSGDLFPSATDDKLTNQIYEAGKIMEIQLLDHLIITTDGFYSYADQGKI